MLFDQHSRNTRVKPCFEDLNTHLAGNEYWIYRHGRDIPEVPIALQDPLGIFFRA